MRVLAWLAMMTACSFNGHGVADDDTEPSDAAPPIGSDAPTGTDAPSAAINLVAPENGGVVVAASSNYCDINGNGASDCAPGYWHATNLVDGDLGAGVGTEAAPEVWCSAFKHGIATPEEFTFTFASHRSATIERVRIQNFTDGGDYFVTALQLLDAGRKVVLEMTLPRDEKLHDFVLPAPATTNVAILRIVAGNRDDFWELGEVEIWGQLQ